MEWIILILAGCLVFGICFTVLALKVYREGSSTKLHTCGHSLECQCGGKIDSMKEVLGNTSPFRIRPGDRISD